VIDVLWMLFVKIEFKIEQDNIKPCEE
jgi:hypothetical protein